MKTAARVTVRRPELTPEERAERELRLRNALAEFFIQYDRYKREQEQEETP